MRKRLVFLFLVCFALEIGVSFHLLTSPREQTEQVRFVPSPEYVKSISGTFRPLFAQMLFLKGVQELGNNASEKTDYLFAIFLASFQLDPELRNAAFLGGVVLPRKPAEILKGIALLEEAMKLKPNEWRLPYWIGFNYSQLEDYKRTAEYYKQASRLPDSPTFLKTNLAFLYYQAESPESGILSFQALKESATDEGMLELIQEKIDWLKNIVLLEQKVSDYKKQFGMWPASLNELVEKGLLREIPSDPFGDGYYLDRSLGSGTEKCRVKSKF